jgi:hypothetical protein
MKFDRNGIGGMALAGLVVFALTLGSSARAEGTQQRSAKVISIKGDARYNTGDGKWQPLTLKTVLPPGSVVQTAEDSTADLLLDGQVQLGVATAADGAGYLLPSGRNYAPPVLPPSQAASIVRLQPKTTLAIDKLTTTPTGADVVNDTQLDLRAGKIFGSTKKVTGASKYEIKLPNGVAAIRGTIYAVGADGAVAVLSGSVFVTVTKPDGSTSTVRVPAGSALNPVTGEIYPLPVDAGAALSDVVAAMGMRVYTVPTSYSVDNTTVWVSPTAGTPPPPE